ncbi:MAG: NlpA lipoprotein, partial [Ligilactobacillus sp.]|nr:NlpA lipoprotein [Ligilactobacillus sp.]
MKHTKFLTALGAFLLVVLTLSACAPSEDAVKNCSSSAKSDKKVTLNIG